MPRQRLELVYSRDHAGDHREISIAVEISPRRSIASQLLDVCQKAWGDGRLMRQRTNQGTAWWEYQAVPDGEQQRGAPLMRQ